MSGESEINVQLKNKLSNKENLKNSVILCAHTIFHDVLLDNNSTFYQSFYNSTRQR